MSSLAPRDVLAGLLAVQRRLIDADELNSVLLSLEREDSASLELLLRRRLGDSVWAELQQSASQTSGSIPALQIPPNVTVADPSRTPATRSDDSVGAHTPPTPRPARYTRLARHAEGGLGVVYVACDEELGRDVALKEIKERHADRPASRSRFVFEAEVTGRLEHPGIVPVYGLGTYADGRPYYAMRFIKGHTLEEAIKRFHEADKAPRDATERAMTLRGLLNRFVSVCNALGYAHSQGILHRDVKPANVMLGEYGETLVVDWGLAKKLGIDHGRPDGIVVPPSHAGDAGDSLHHAQTPSSPGGTEQGAIIGTPNYMPPEQALGDADHVGPRSDVYSLGATLYQLVTGKMAFDEPAVEPTLEKVIRGDFTAARQANPRVPAALEAVCKQAMAVEPADRYASAGELGEEIERWLADEPVSAYAEPASVKLRRWARRNRPLVASGVALLIAGVVGLSLGLWAVNNERARTAEQRDQVQENLKRAVAAEKEANANLKLARQAVDECFGLAKNHPLLQEPGAKPIRKLMLEKTLPFYKNFRVQRPDDPKLAADRADYLVRVGWVTSEIDRKDKALASYLEAVDELRQLRRKYPDNRDYRTSLAAACNDSALVTFEVGKFSEARRLAAESYDLFAALSRDRPDDLDSREGQATAAQTLGVVLAQTDVKAARKRDEEALRLYQELSKADPRNEDYATGQATLMNNVGKQKMDAGDLGAARKLFEEGRRRYVDLLSKRPGSARYRTRLADVSSNLGVLFAMTTGRQAEAARRLEEARRIYLELSETYPDVTEYKAALARTYVRALLEQQQGKSDDAMKSYAEARRALEGLCKQHPEVVRFRFELAVTCNDAGEVYRQSGRWKEAAAHFGTAMEYLDGLHAAHPEVVTYQLLLGVASNNAALMHLHLGQLEKAEKAFARSRKHLEQAVRQSPDDVVARLTLVLAMSNLSYLHAANGRAAQAVESGAAAIEKGNALVNDSPSLHQGQYVLAMAHVNHGRALSVLGEIDAAFKSLDEGLAVSRKLKQAHPGVPDYEAAHATGCCVRAFLANAQGKFKEARKNAQEAHDVLDPLHKAQPEMVQHTFYLGMACSVLAHVTAVAGDADGGLTYAKKALELLGPLAKKYPSTAEYVAGVGSTHLNMGAIYLLAQRSDDAEKHLGEARKVYRELSRTHAHVPDYQVTLAQIGTSLGLLYAVTDRSAAARKAAEEAGPILEKAIQKYPKNTQMQALLGLGELISALALLEEKDPRGAKVVRQAQKRLADLDRQGQLAPPQRIFLAISCKILGLLAANEDKYADAAGQFEKMRDVLTSLVEALPKAAVYRNELVDACLMLGACQGELKKMPAARSSLRQARQHALKLHKDAPAVPLFQARVGFVCQMLAKALAGKEALAALDEAVEALSAACKSEPKNAQFRSWHKDARVMRAHELGVAKRPLDAVRDLDVAVTLEADPKARTGLRLIRVELLLSAGDHREASISAEGLSADEKLPAGQLLSLSEALARAAALAAGDVARPLPEREKAAGGYLRLALQLLKRTDRAGGLDRRAVESIKTKKAFAPLRQRADFQTWLQQRQKGERE